MDAIYDCHLHTEFSADSETPVRDQMEKAIFLGMREICITDHHDPGSQFCPDDFTLDLPTYIESLRKIKDEYADRIRLNIGIELGLQNHVGDYLRDLPQSGSWSGDVGLHFRLVGCLFHPYLYFSGIE